MNDINWHDQLKSRYRIQGRLAVKTPLRISSGSTNDVTDAPFIRDAADRPYMPGSSLRGAVRSALERIISGLGPDITGLSACTLFSGNACMEIEENRDRLKEIMEIAKESERMAAMERFIADTHCDICRLFGSTVFATRIYFRDAFVEETGGEVPLCLIRDGVGIDRDSGAAVTGAKYDYEVVDPGNDELAFAFDATVENPGEKDKKLVGVMLRVMTEGFHVGGKLAGGLGALQLSADSITISGFGDAQTAWQRLVEGNPLMAPFAEDTWEEVFLC